MKEKADEKEVFIDEKKLTIVRIQNSRALRRRAGGVSGAGGETFSIAETASPEGGEPYENEGKKNRFEQGRRLI